MAKKPLPGTFTRKQRGAIKHWADAIHRAEHKKVSGRPKSWMPQFIIACVELCHQTFVQRQLILNPGDHIEIEFETDDHQSVEKVMRLTNTGSSVEMEGQNISAPEPDTTQLLQLMPIDLVVLIELYAYGRVDFEMKSRPAHFESFTRLESHGLVELAGTDDLYGAGAITLKGEQYIKVLTGQSSTMEPKPIVVDTSVNELLA